MLSLSLAVSNGARRFRLLPLSSLIIACLAFSHLSVRAASLFSTPVTTTVPVRQAPDTQTLGEPDFIVHGDFNRDGSEDLALVNLDQGTNYLCTGNLVFLLDDGKGNFSTSEKPNFCVPLPFVHKAMTAMDFDKDGKTDLAITNYTNHDISVMLGDSFAPWTDYNTGNNPYAIISGDLDADGLADIVTANLGDNSVSVLINNSRGTFLGAVNYPVDKNPVSVAMGDFNGDKKVDLATANESSGTVSTLFGNGNGTFQPKTSYTAGQQPSSLVAGDFNNDGKADLAVANAEDNTVSLFLSRPEGTFDAKVDYAVGSDPTSLVADDLNHDGKLDLAVANKDSDNVSVLINRGDGTFLEHRDFAVGTQPVSLTTGDLNGDGRADLAVANAEGRTVSLLTQLSPGDLDLNGKVDLADLRLLLQVYLGLLTPTTDQIFMGDTRPKTRVDNQDVFGDDKIGADDLNWLLRRVLDVEKIP